MERNSSITRFLGEFGRAIIFSVDERSFVESRKSAWDELSATLDRLRVRGVRSLSRRQIESLGSGYQALVSDLAFARTQGASEDLIAYLNNLAGRAHGALYASDSPRARALFSFLLRDYPAAFRRSWRYIFAAVLIFIIGWATAAGLLYTIPEARAALLPERLSVRGHASPPENTPSETEMRFRAPDPASISSFIMTNNIREGIIAFAGGITFGALTVFTLFKNGLIIGGILIILATASQPVVLLSLLLPHGFIELTAIFACGGGGLMMGAALIAPGNLRRADAVRLAAGKALTLFAGAVPMFAAAAIIEGFVTPAPIPAFAKLAFAAITAIGLVLYLGFAGREA
ncbi:MAG: stage II sporulation protein M [Armatimonadota bacterium]